LWPAGSFLGDFRTPAGARNSSRKKTVSFRANSQDEAAVPRPTHYRHFPSNHILLKAVMFAARALGDGL